MKSQYILLPPLIFLASLVIQTWIVYEPTTTIRYKGLSLKKLYEESLNQYNERNSEYDSFIQRAKLKPASNSYVDAVFPKRQGLNNELISTPQRENATILMLCRNWELFQVLKSMRSLEDRFNKDYHYTWTFLNDVPFTDEFKIQTTAMASGLTEYGLIPSDNWDTPSFINQTKYDECVDDFVKREVIYGFSKSYRNMCHFNSGFFYKQELLLKYQYYFRVEPEVEYFCDFQMDPFRLMRENGKKYGFVITLLEYQDTIETLWDNVENYMNEYPDSLHENSSIEFITDTTPIGAEFLKPDYNSHYNLCHFWSNFEIADLDFFRSDEYESYFQYLSEQGGFYYERWGDAPVHSIAAALLLDKSEIHHFEDIGYSHVPFYTCPESTSLKSGKRCICPDNGENNIDLQAHSCLSRWWKFGSGKKFMRDYFHEEDYV
ncbi:glycosyltransferase family 15 protein [[Candida] arabinofermentans NRRL YB-2248]|uniref:Glycosyltransferase family 15 protein n=1 Tax=[Candida] arabinofermentans NRRL YB-2248 TaxID=983967 RepID=A0A1E4SWZ7_9ASCO|nr:glycosyltransferase family 15 protein [[Candida] arabinofermentans NRRL YB-2248]